MNTVQMLASYRKNSPYLKRQRRQEAIATLGYVAIMVVVTLFCVGLLWAATK